VLITIVNHKLKTVAVRRIQIHCSQIPNSFCSKRLRSSEYSSGRTPNRNRIRPSSQIPNIGSSVNICIGRIRLNREREGVRVHRRVQHKTRLSRSDPRAAQSSRQNRSSTELPITSSTVWSILSKVGHEEDRRKRSTTCEITYSIVTAV